MWSGLFANLDVANFSKLKPRVGSDELPVKVEKDEGESFPAGSKIRKHHHMDEEDVEENRSSKQAAIFSEPTLRSSMIDIILLHSLGDGKKHFMARREALQTKNDQIVVSNGKSKASNGGKGRSKKQNGKSHKIYKKERATKTDFMLLKNNCAKSEVDREKGNKDED